VTIAGFLHRECRDAKQSEEYATMSNYLISPYPYRPDRVPSLTELAGITFLRDLERTPPREIDAQFVRNEIIPHVAVTPGGRTALHSFAAAAACGPSSDRVSYLNCIFTAGGCPAVRPMVNGQPMRLEQLAQLHNNPVAATYLKEREQEWTGRVHASDSSF
jgi:hypothetical protein